MNDFEVNQSGPAGFFVVNDIRRRRIPMRPGAGKFVASKLMRMPKFSSSGFQHPARQGAFVQVVPETFPRQLIEANRSATGSGRPKTIAIEHSETVRLPALPLFGSAPEANRYARHAKIQIGQVGQLFAV
jgi:hypothetical protein